MPRALHAALAGLALVPQLALGQARPVTPVDSLSLYPGDVIHVEVWPEKDLGGSFVVDPYGRASLPLIGETAATGLTQYELRRQLLEAYRAQLRNPSVAITFLLRVSILGAVTKPGVYAVDPRTTVAGAVAEAGGPTADGDLSRSQIRRDSAVVSRRAGPGATLDRLGVRSGDMIVVGQRSWFTRNSTFVVSTVISVASIAIALLRR